MKAFQQGAIFDHMRRVGRAVTTKELMTVTGSSYWATIAVVWRMHQSGHLVGANGCTKRVWRLAPRARRPVDGRGSHPASKGVLEAHNRRRFHTEPPKPVLELERCWPSLTFPSDNGETSTYNNSRHGARPENG